MATLLRYGVDRILYWRKPKSEVANLDATTENLKIDGTVNALNELLRVMAKVNRLEAAMDKQREEARLSVAFYRQQLTYFEELDLAYRKRSHATNEELSKATLALRLLEMQYRDKTGEIVEPTLLMTGDDLIRLHPLPPPLER